MAGFGKNFIWGTASAAYQVEGAAFEDGKGPSVWDDFAHTPGRTYQGDHADVGADHYHHLEEDLQLMSDLHYPAYRFSVSWPRVLPEGSGKINEKGIDFYNRLIDGLLERNIRPFMTLFHWDYPSALMAKGAWENPDSPEWFAEYAHLIASRFGDRVKDFITINEPFCIINLGYQLGANPPGTRSIAAQVIPMTHHLMLSHGKAAQILRSEVPGCRITYSANGDAGIPLRRTCRDEEAAYRAFFHMEGEGVEGGSVAWWCDPVYLGTYPQEELERYGRYLPKGWQDDLKTIHQPLDWCGYNIYNGFHVKESSNSQGWERVNEPMGHPKTAIGWQVVPETMYWLSKHLYKRYGLPILITENGMSCHDWVALDGAVHDPNRIDYMHRFLREYKRAGEEGVPISGYFAWSILDNFEWGNGFHDRFGLVFVDYQTGKRTVKDSARWYSQVIAANGSEI